MWWQVGKTTLDYGVQKGVARLGWYMEFEIHTTLWAGKKHGKGGLGDSVLPPELLKRNCVISKLYFQKLILKILPSLEIHDV